VDIDWRKLFGSPYQLYDGQVSATNSSRPFNMMIDSSKPGIFWAGYGSSAAVETITYVASLQLLQTSIELLLSSSKLSNYYDYFTPIREYMPQNCSSDVQAVIAYLDQMYATNDTAGIKTLQESFALGALDHVGDFATARESSLCFSQSSMPAQNGHLHTSCWCNVLFQFVLPSPDYPLDMLRHPFGYKFVHLSLDNVIFLNLTYYLLYRLTLLESIVQYNLWDWQSLAPGAYAGTLFYQFCDALEVKNGVNAGPDGWGLDNAIESWGNFWNTTYYNHSMVLYLTFN
jgi:hypothetical protein